MDAFDIEPADLAVEDRVETDSEPSVALLVAQARHGNVEARQVLVQRFSRRAYAVALGVLRRAEDAEDIVQESFTVALMRLDSCRDPDRFHAWLFQIVRNRARNLLQARRLREHRYWSGTANSVDALTTDASTRDAIKEAVDQLSMVQREVVRLHDAEDWTHKEIAEHLSITEVNSRQHLFQARRVLRSILRELSPATP